MKTVFTDAFDKEYLKDTMMGPNAMHLAEELADAVPVKAGMRVLDLGCGRGISSILVAKKFDVKVFAADLWVPPEENNQRFAQFGLEDQIVPLLIDATEEMPFAEDYFDVLFSVDSCHYFGCDEVMLPSLTPYVKRGGHIAVAVPGLVEELDTVPVELQPFWQDDMNFHSTDWWRALWQKEPSVCVNSCRVMDNCRQAWA